MCRYPFKRYKSTYVCFNCQVGFKRRNIYDINPDVTESKEAKCPNCGIKMLNAGRDLRLPKKEEDEQWRCIKYLVDNNYNIYSCGCQGIGFVPHKMEEAIDLVTNVSVNLKKELYNDVKKAKQIEIKQQRKKNADNLRTKLLLREVKKENIELGKKIDKAPKVSHLNFTILNKRETETILHNFSQNNTIEIPFEIIDENYQYSLSIDVNQLNIEQIEALKTFFE